MKLRILGSAILGAAGLVMLGTWIGSAIASGQPDAPMTYSGDLTDNGSPASGSYQIGLNLWKTADTSSVANELCAVPASTIAVTAGHFQLPLTAQCRAVFQSNLGVFYEVTVNGTSLGTAAVGSVPYAQFSLVAGHVQHAAATNSDAGIVPVYTSGPAYCGSTAATNGGFSATNSSGQAVKGIPAAKVLCESACGSKTAHLCSLVELQAYERTVGGPAPVPASGWILGTAMPCNQASWLSGNGCPADLVEPFTVSGPPVPLTCTYQEAGANYTLTGVNEGNTYGPAGSGLLETVDNIGLVKCDQMLPIHCCD